MRRLVILIICACALPVSGARAWTWPVDGPVLRPFSFDHSHPYASGQHRGVDLGAPSGSAVLAPAEGVVSFAGTVPTGGKTVSIQTPFGYTATLVHLGSIGVTRGAFVGEASVVGTIGPSGVARSDRALRVLRHACNERSPGLRRSLGLPASARRAVGGAVCTCCGRRHVACS